VVITLAWSAFDFRPAQAGRRLHRAGCRLQQELEGLDISQHGEALQYFRYRNTVLLHARWA